MKTANLNINDSKRTITVDFEANLLPIEKKLLNQYSRQGYTIRPKRKSVNKMKKMDFYIDALAEYALDNDDMQPLEHFNEICETMGFGKAVKYYNAWKSAQDAAEEQRERELYASAGLDYMQETEEEKQARIKAEKLEAIKKNAANWKNKKQAKVAEFEPAKAISAKKVA